MNDNENENLNDVSSNDDVSSNNDDNEYETHTEFIYDPIDYSQYFENLQTIGILISGLLVAYGLAFAFFKGIKR